MQVLINVAAIVTGVAFGWWLGRRTFRFVGQFSRRRVVVTSISVNLTFVVYLALYLVALNTLSTAMAISLVWQLAILIIAARCPSSLVRIASMSIVQSDSRK